MFDKIGHHIIYAKADSRGTLHAFELFLKNQSLLPTSHIYKVYNINYQPKFYSPYIPTNILPVHIVPPPLCVR